MNKTATVFDYCDLPHELLDYLDTWLDYVRARTVQCVEIPLNWTMEDFADEGGVDLSITDAYFELVTHLKANMIAGTELAIIY